MIFVNSLCPAGANGRALNFYCQNVMMNERSKFEPLSPVIEIKVQRIDISNPTTKNDSWANV
jgi:hypothetical protein